MFENADKTKDSQVYLFDVIIFLEYLPNNHILKIKSSSSLISAPISEPNTSLQTLILFLPYIIPDIGKPIITRSRQVFKSLKCYNI